MPHKLTTPATHARQEIHELYALRYLKSKYPRPRSVQWLRDNIFGVGILAAIANILFTNLVRLYAQQHPHTFRGFGDLIITLGGLLVPAFLLEPIYIAITVILAVCFLVLVFAAKRDREAEKAQADVEKDKSQTYAESLLRGRELEAQQKASRQQLLTILEYYGVDSTMIPDEPLEAYPNEAAFLPLCLNAIWLLRTSLRGCGCACARRAFAASSPSMAQQALANPRWRAIW